MNDKQYVVRAAKMMKLDLFPATRSNKDILAYAKINGFNKCVVDAQNWQQAREQINKFAQQRAQAA